MSHSLTLWCQAEYKPHVHESETSISCQFMRRLWIIQLWQPGTRNERRGDKMGRMRELRQLIHFSYVVVHACVHEWEYVHLHDGVSAAWDAVWMSVCMHALTLCWHCVNLAHCSHSCAYLVAWEYPRICLFIHSITNGCVYVYACVFM